MEAIIVNWAQFIFDIWNENNGMGIKEWGKWNDGRAKVG